LENVLCRRSPAASEHVRAQVNLNNPANVRLNQSVTLSGSVAPAHPGSTVTLTITRPGAQAVTVNATLAANSTYSVQFSPPARATYTVVANFAGDADHAAGQSVSRTFRVS
jgi:Bacterial Ig-like domain (group 3)